MSDTFQIGQKPTLIASFTDEDGIAADPTSVTFKVKDPAGTETSYTDADSEVTNPATGSWECELPTLDAAGRWYWRVDGTGAVTAANETFFIVDSSQFATP